MNKDRRPPTVHRRVDIGEAPINLYSDNYLNVAAFLSMTEWGAWNDGIPENYAAQIHIDDGSLVVVADMPVKVIGWDEFTAQEEVTV